MYASPFSDAHILPSDRNEALELSGILTKLDTEIATLSRLEKELDGTNEDKLRRDRSDEALQKMKKRRQAFTQLRELRRRYFAHVLAQPVKDGESGKKKSLKTMLKVTPSLPPPTNLKARFDELVGLVEAQHEKIFVKIGECSDDYALWLDELAIIHRLYKYELSEEMERIVYWKAGDETY